MEGIAVLGDRTLAGALAGASRARLENELLPAFVERQRWFGRKAAGARRVALVDHGAFARDASLAVADVTSGDGATESYALPVGVVSGDDARAVAAERPGSAIAWLDRPGGRLLVDGLADDAGSIAWLGALAERDHLPLEHGRIAITRNRPIDSGAPHFRPVRRTGAEQSNSSVVFGRAAILKLYRRLQAGVHPEIELGQYLLDAGYSDVPALLLSVEYRRDGLAYALAVVHALVPDATDGWDHALGLAGEYYARVAPLPVGRAAALAAEGTLLDGARRGLSDEARLLAGDVLAPAATLGAQTADLHVTLARAADPALAPEPFTAADLALLVERTRARAGRALGLLEEHAASAALPPRAAERAAVLLARRPAVFDRLDAGLRRGLDATRTRCHQDYHLGQVLWTSRGRYALLDFEGEPLRPLHERREKRSPLTDVAGMLRSYSYAAWSALFAWCERHEVNPLEREPWAALWETAAATEFLRAYLAGTASASFIPSDAAQLAGLLDVLLLDKALYELEYELNNRPAWIMVPVEGIIGLLA